MWNVTYVSSDWKSVASREDTISMLHAVFLAAVTGSAGCIT